MPGTTPPTSQLEWLSSTTAMIVLFWSRAMRDLLRACPGAGVVSREFSEELGGCLVVEASQAGAIVVGDEGVEVGVAFIVVAKAAMVGDMVLRHPVEMLAEAAVEALDHAVGLRSEGPGEAVSDRALGAELVKGMGARGFVVGLGFLVDGAAVGKFGAVVGQDGVDRKREAVEEAREKTRGGGGAAIGEDFEIDKASSAIDRDIGVAAPAAERRQVFDIDVDKAGRRVGSESGGRCLVGGEAGGEIVPHQAAVDSAARQLRVDAAAHRFDDVVERQREVRRSSTISASSQSVTTVARRCGRVERSATSWRARQRATVRR